MVSSSKPNFIRSVSVGEVLEKCCFQYCDMQIASEDIYMFDECYTVGCKAAGRTYHQWCTTLQIYKRHILILHSIMDIHTMQHLYIVRKNIRDTLIDTTLYIRDVCNSWTQLLNSLSWFFKLVAATFEVVATTFKHFITSIAFLCHFVTGDHHFWNSKVMATSFKGRGHITNFRQR